MLTNIIFPIKCGICGKLGNYICKDCIAELKNFEIKKQYEDVFFVYDYEGKIRELILKYKFKDSPFLYKTFTECLLKNKKVCQFLKSYDIILSVPLHKKRLRQRGYDQSQLIAKELAKKFNYNLHNKKELIYYNNILIKNKNTKPQSLKDMQSRIKDVIGIYEVKNIEKILGKNIVIFDDIYTTGSTLKECKKVLLEAGAKNVGILALAKDYIN